MMNIPEKTMMARIRGQVRGMITLIVLIVSGLMNDAAMAQAVCQLASGTPAINANMPLALSNITAGPDMPVGTVIYHEKFVPTYQPTMNCSASPAGSYVLNQVLSLSSTPKPLSAYGGSPFGGQVYETNIPGLGVAIWADNQAVTTATPYIRQSFSPPDGDPQSWHADTSFDISLIKTGNILPGTLSSASLPSVVWQLQAASGAVQGLPMAIASLSFKSSINIVSQSCTTSDFTVQMGSYEKDRYFSGVGSATPWVDSSITLNNCPQFWGYYDATPVQWSNNYILNVPNATQNMLSVQLTPSTPIIDATQGIMSVDGGDEGSAATGIGIQLAWGSASGSPAPFNFAIPQNYTAPSDGRTSLQIPLAARYYQTEDKVTSGKANGKAVFVINYY
jgi:major type 1 subunit fimbrin (pilin)